jgi:hypothetical protein
MEKNSNQFEDIPKNYKEIAFYHHFLIYRQLTWVYLQVCIRNIESVGTQWGFI